MCVEYSKAIAVLITKFTSYELVRVKREANGHRDQEKAVACARRAHLAAAPTWRFGWTVYLDTTTPLMNTLTIRGTLIVPPDFNKSISLHANAKYAVHRKMEITTRTAAKCLQSEV